MWKEISPYDLEESSFRLIDKEWMLITAGGPEEFNTMTASWGGFGIIWNRPVAFIFVRPQRFTYEFLERNELFTLSFFGREYRNALNFCGSHSGRDTDKVKATGFIPEATARGAVYFAQARIMIECKKIYHNDLNPGNFLDRKIFRNYPEQDYHRMYFGEILHLMIKE